jgi:type III secretory pathway component EscR
MHNLNTNESYNFFRNGNARKQYKLFEYRPIPWYSPLHDVLSKQTVEIKDLEAFINDFSFWTVQLVVSSIDPFHHWWEKSTEKQNWTIVITCNAFMTLKEQMTYKMEKKKLFLITFTWLHSCKIRFFIGLMMLMPWLHADELINNMMKSENF